MPKDHEQERRSNDHIEAAKDRIEDFLMVWANRNDVVAKVEDGKTIFLTVADLEEVIR